MTLYTKSIEQPKEENDGYRICIMRNPSKYQGKYDHWMPELSPEQELREKVKHGLNWEEFKPEFERYLQSQVDSLDYVAQKSKTRNVTLLCVENTPDRCIPYHR
tara:strand:- start:4813 stop:5124 length:312 start_codon:yes stop_codon:yes gene_type:complete